MNLKSSATKQSKDAAVHDKQQDLKDLDPSDQILETAVTIVRRFRTLTSTTNMPDEQNQKETSSDDFVIVNDSDNDNGTSPSNPVSSEHAQMLLFNEYSDFAEKYPYLFRMCTNVPTEESADNFVQILPLMLRQRDKIIESKGTQMKSATEAIIEKLHDTYVAPHGIDRSSTTKKKVAKKIAKKSGV